MTVMPTFRVGTAAGMELEIYDLQPGAKMACRTYGDPRRLERGYSQRRLPTSAPFPPTCLGLGSARLVAISPNAVRTSASFWQSPEACRSNRRRVWISPTINSIGGAISFPAFKCSTG